MIIGWQYEWNFVRGRRSEPGNAPERTPGRVMREAVRRRAMGIILVGMTFAWVHPALAGSLLDEIDGLRGQVVYLDFWASWCIPCRESFPWMQSIAETYGHSGLTVLAVNLDRDHADAERFLERYHPGFAVRFDPQGSLAEHFHVPGMPTSVIIDRHGQLRYTHIGFKAADAPGYEAQVRALLAEPK